MNAEHKWILGVMALTAITVGMACMIAFLQWRIANYPTKTIDVALVEAIFQNGRKQCLEMKARKFEAHATGLDMVVRCQK